jgi:predicted nucleic acid-binding protein
MDYLIDSDVLNNFLKGDPDTVRTVGNFLPAGVAISIVTYMEAYQGVLQDPDPIASQQRYADTLKGIPILPFSEVTARRCAHLRHQLSLEGKRVRPRALDLMIAATALEHNLTLVTRNRVDYQDIPGLTLA